MKGPLLQNDKDAEKKVREVRVSILGIGVDRLTLEQAKKTIRDRWGSNTGVFHVVTANAEMIYHGSGDRELARVIKKAGMVTADGAGVVLAARILGCPVPERVAGYDLMIECLQEAACSGAPVYFLGAQPQVLGQAVERALKRFPGLNIAGSHHGYFHEDDEEDIVREIHALKPCLLLVALGVPKQEKWIFRYREKLPPCAVIGVGGSFDVLAGKLTRAPGWMQRAGLEWLYRLAKEPARIGRAAVLPAFLLQVFLQALHIKRY
jgi:N-acetylglucosaminyldiphosphoundecaprenol N-acetyl-beta-D-mannosaminyltransferase